MKFALCSGGIGDAIIGIAEARRRDCLLIHAANRFNRDTISAVIDAFGVPSIVFDGSFSDELNSQYETWAAHPDCISTCHLPDKMSMSDWNNRKKYEERICTEMPVQDMFGKCECHPIIICPTGSGSPSTVKNGTTEYIKNRSLSAVELASLVARCVSKNIVYIIGSPEQQEHYGLIPHPSVYWLNFEGITDYHGKYTPSTIETTFRLINGAKHVLSVDTWLKTYSAYAKVPTTVIRTRYNDQYLTNVDLSENIFLNKRLWNFNLCTIEELLEIEE